MTITHFGAAHGVTGSKHLIDTGSSRVLLDCGMFQGDRDVHVKNRDIPFDVASLDAVVLSHAHLDHCGMLPVLVKAGWRGTIYASAATRDIAEQILLDAAGIAMDRARRAKRHHRPHEETIPIYTPEDIPHVMQRFEPIPYARNKNRWHDIATNVRCKLYDAGHILGSSIVVLEITAGDMTHTIAFTGDIGAPGMPILHDPEVPTEHIDTAICEATYGDTIHPPFKSVRAELGTAIRRISERKGIIVIPAFSLGRTQRLIYLIHQLVDAGEIPEIPIAVDSPLSTSITDVFRAHRNDYDLESEQDFPGDHHVPLAFEQLHYVRSQDESRALNGKHGPRIIIASSGMMTNGRVIHHLRHTIQDPKNAIFITGYQAEGTTGRDIQNGASEVRLHGKPHTVRAEVITFPHLSAHADQTQLTTWLEALNGLSRVILVHAEPDASTALHDHLAERHPKWNIDIPKENEKLSL
jgi:metallo-beta-lactamase family protein